MKKKFVKIIICTVLALTISGGSIITNAAENTLLNAQEVNNNLDIEQMIEKPTEEDLIANEEKMKLAEEYIQNKKKARGYGYLVTLANGSYQTAIQQQGYWCGPAAAYNATNGKRTQSQYAMDFATSESVGTRFNNTWKYVMDTDRPGNNYTLSWGSNYSYADWKAHLKNSIIYTIDKRYPVIADTYITSDSSTWLHSGYDYATSTYHYVVVVGYDDSITAAEALIVDSNPRSGIPVKYWTTIDKLAKASQTFGIVW